MRDERRDSLTQRMGFMGSLLMFVLIFTLCCGTLAGVFARAQVISRETEVYNSAVTLCRSQAERFRSGEIPRDGSRLYFDGGLAPCEEEESAYWVGFSLRDEGVEGLVGLSLTAGERGGEPVYSLNVAAYAPKEG